MMAPTTMLNLWNCKYVWYCQYRFFSCCLKVLLLALLAGCSWQSSLSCYTQLKTMVGESLSLCLVFSEVGIILLTWARPTVTRERSPRRSHLWFTTTVAFTMMGLPTVGSDDLTVKLLWFLLDTMSMDVIAGRCGSVHCHCVKFYPIKIVGIIIGVSIRQSHSKSDDFETSEFSDFVFCVVGKVRLTFQNSRTLNPMISVLL